MTSHVRHSLLTFAALAGALAAPAHAVTQSAAVNANVVKPLTLVALQGLNLGTITLPPGSWSGATVGISRTGQFTCSAKVTCTGAPTAATFNVTGTNRMAVRVTAPNVTLVNQSNSAQTLTLVLDSPGQVTLPNSGNQGVTFNIGGSVTVASTTASGTYRGTINVTVDYQ
jgi:spore coat protein U-like protein